MITRGGISHFGEADDIKALTYFTKKVKDLISTKYEFVRAMDHIEDTCNICNLKGHTTFTCLTQLAFRVALHEQANVPNTLS